MAKLFSFETNERRRILFSTIAVTSVVFLIPWTIYIGATLPSNETVNHWDLAWTGFDAFLIVSIAVTARAALVKSTWTFVLAPMTAIMLLVDAWFDIVTASNKTELIEAIISAVVGEIPFAIFCLIATIVSHKAVFKKSPLSQTKP